MIRSSKYQLLVGFGTLILLNFESLAFERLYRNPIFYGRGHSGVADNENLDNIYNNTSVLKKKLKIVKKCRFQKSKKKKYSSRKKSVRKLKRKRKKCNFVKKGKTRNYLVIFPTLELSKPSSDLIRAKTEDERLEFIRKNIGKPLYLRNTQLFIMQVGTSAFGFLQEIQAAALASNDLENKGIETAEVDFHKTLAFSFVRSQHISNFSLGIGLHFINREFAHKKSAITDVEAMKNMKNIKNTRTGNGIAADFGLIYSVLNRKLNLGLGVSNIGYTAIRKNLFKGDQLQIVNQLVDLGIKYSFRTFGLKNKLYLDFKNIENRQKDSVFKHIHFGHDVTVFRSLTFSWGFNQGYLSLGIKGSYKNFLITFGKYSEELGETVGFRQDERYFFQLRFNN